MDLGNFLNQFQFIRENPIHASQLRKGVVLKNGEFIYESGRILDSQGRTNLHLKTVQKTSDMPDGDPYDFFKWAYPDGILEFHYLVKGNFSPELVTSALIGPSKSDAFYKNVRGQIAA